MADSTNKRLKLIRNRIEAHGGTVTAIRVGKHCKIRFTTPSGVPKLLVVSVSPSDHRVDRHVERDIRHLMRA